MTEEEWLDGLKNLPDDVILDIHFGLQEKIKKHYKLRDKGDNLNKAIHFCEQQIALSSRAMKAMKNNPAMYNGSEFFAPSHYGFKQYSVILKKRKELEKLSEITEKMKREGWR
ncbi:hypothetical protein ISO70_10695 [Morganella morganii subsp. morganii]|uniref:hypothetical protein n=1 Tax=Morganella morganii TaxID=582 RepID=UPI0005FC1ECE|nr:hypothetical protein [Morganella morganii]EKU4288277.1 hypothetical protein [Morganella morganii]EKU4302382.1 hypothetical protein [Morganella morganii]EKU5662228.1 hypothetical protein [Morganella morganii]EKU5690212.1 hypothetical protein [Morganella morganii]EKY1475448.1 hypothetical protein [Morganella morganii]